MDMVKWSQRTISGVATRGMMADDMVQEKLLCLANAARDVIKTTDYDHVLYGMKIYDKNRLKTVHFYMWPMKDEQFKKVTAHAGNSVIYAIHKC